MPPQPDDLGTRATKMDTWSNIQATGLTPLYESQDAMMDVVFIHGIAGHPYRTWASSPSPNHHTPGPNEVMWLAGSSPQAHQTPSSNIIEVSESDSGYWPAQLVPTAIPNSRVLTYGYDVEIRHHFPLHPHIAWHDHAKGLVVSLEAARHTEDEKTRPIIFIAHSLGGIIIKEALVYTRGLSAKSRGSLSHIFDSTKTVLFFGTPHRAVDLTEILHDVSRVIGFRINPGVLHAFGPESDWLKNLKEDFTKICKEENWTIYSFLEGSASPTLNRKIVENHSAYLDEPAVEIAVPIWSDHGGMCRFSGLDDPEYRKVEAALCHIVGMIKSDGRSVSGTESSPLPPCLSVRDARVTVTEH
ncbi:hypothetical protein QBC40DRAFT_287873 [Triangularia verruculosa]|uniref:Uncharacterized protein n=1 Tax=Triangularia verruculosa TaxID=2587418 RepID=A0AAN6XB10_9PEZI|nr:hypothetical protein QBC40DRAFT_287873 [Triangularia verruculosa]